MSDVSEIVGKTPTKIKQTEDDIIMTFTDGSVGRFWHSQDCCEVVVVDDVSGDWADLIGSPILVADKRQGEYLEHEKGPDDYWRPSHTWTFYTFRGIGGSVDVRWHGSSNGYYSESVSFDLRKP